MSLVLIESELFMLMEITSCTREKLSDVLLGPDAEIIRYKVDTEPQVN